MSPPVEVPPLYDEIDYIVAPERKIDLKTFLQECPNPPEQTPSRKRDRSARPPKYTCTVARHGVLLRKMENILLDNAGKLYYPFRRNWTEVYAVLTGTKLELYRPANCSKGHALRPTSQDGIISRCASLPQDPAQDLLRSRPRSASAAPRPQEFNPDDLIKQYSLLGAMAGVACDYSKKDNVLRVRAENDQFLIQCGGSRDAIEWLEAFHKASNISDPLESRAETRIFSAPRRFRSKNKDLAYEVFEAANPNAPLRQRTHVSVLGATVSGSRSTSATRTADARSRNEVLSRALSEAFNSNLVLDPRDGDEPNLPTSTTPSEDISTSIHSDLGVDLESGTLSGGSSRRSALRSEKALMPRQLRPRKRKNERFICAVLPASHPRKLNASISRPQIAC